MCYRVQWTNVGVKRVPEFGCSVGKGSSSLGAEVNVWDRKETCC